MPKQQWEIEAKDRFLNFLGQTNGQVWTVLAEDVVVDRVTNRNFDYQLGTDERRMALELFRLVEDQEELARERVWGEVVNALKTELPNRGVKGFLIHTPPYFRVSRPKRDAFVKELADKLEQAIKANKGLEEFELDGFRLTKIESLGEEVVFGTFGKGGAVDPPGIALAALEDKLPDKNEQLAIQDHERALLIINWAYIVGTSEVIEACSQIDFNRFSNVDKIYFEPEQGTIDLVFDRDLFAWFEALQGPRNPELEPLYLRWLVYRLGRRDRGGFEIVKRITFERGDPLWLPALSRADVVRYGQDLVNAGDKQNVDWILEIFKNDPDPKTENDPEDPEGKSNYHLRVLRGEKVHFISGVRADLCWLLAKIATHPWIEFYPRVFRIIEEYARGENLYIRQQATIPLIEFARRRLAHQANKKPFMDSALAAHVRNAAFQMLRENSAYPRILEWVAHVFTWIPDLSENDAEELLAILLRDPTDEAAQSICRLMLYFAVDRPALVDTFGAFDGSKFSQLLQSQVSIGKAAIRTSAVWMLWKRLEEKPESFDQLTPYVLLVPEGPYDRLSFSHFFRITARYTKQHPRLLAPALKKAFHRSAEFIQLNPHETIWDLSFDPWKSVEQLHDAGLADAFLDCVEVIVSYKHRVPLFPAHPIAERLQGIRSSGDRAGKVLVQLQSDS